MATFSPEVWMILALLAAGGVVAVLHTLARYLHSELELQDLRTRVQEVRASYSRRLADMEARERGPILEVEPVDDEPGVAGTIGSGHRRAA